MIYDDLETWEQWIKTKTQKQDRARPRAMSSAYVALDVGQFIKVILSIQTVLRSKRCPMQMCAGRRRALQTTVLDPAEVRLS